MAPRYVYALLDPRYSEIRYVGVSAEPWSRAFLPFQEGRPWQSHVAQALNEGTSHKDYWIQGVVRAGLLPQMVILEHGEWTTEELAQREIWWIAFYRGIGAELTNKSGGGEQTPLWQMSEATKALISDRTRAAMSREDVRRRYEEGMARYRAEHPARPPLTDEERADRRVAGREKNRQHSAAVWSSYTEEQRAVRGRKISEARKKNPPSDQKRLDNGLKMSIGKRVAKARRNGWLLPIIAKS